jgi:hypothetical protein
MKTSFGTCKKETVREDRDLYAPQIAELLLSKMLKRFKSAAVGTEVAIPQHNSRTDMVFFSKRSHCFEIKSAKDTTARLQLQVRAAASVFDYVTVVCSQQKVSSVKNKIPKFVGIWVIDSTRVKIVRHAVLRKRFSLESQLAVLNKEELIRHFGDLIDCNSAVDKKLLATKLKKKNSGQVHRKVMLALRKRYQLSTTEYAQAAQCQQGQMPSVRLLSRSFKKQQTILKNALVMKQFWGNWNLNFSSA